MRRMAIVAVALLTTAAATAANAADPVINEFVLNHVGSDTFEYVEVFDAPGADLSALTLLEIEGDSGGAGRIDTVLPVGNTNSGGFWTAGFFRNDLENGTVSLLLVEDFTGAAGDDLDTDNDGVLDSTPWARVADSVAVFDGGGSDRTYANTVLGASFDGGAFTPGGASRIPDGIDTNGAADWTRNDFALVGIPGVSGSSSEALNTPDASNAIGGTSPTPILRSIPEIQGAGHISPSRFGGVVTTGVVTAVPFSFDGAFYLQDPGDSDSDTSDGIFVTADAGLTGIDRGEYLLVTGVVNESIPGGSATGNLSITQIIPLSIVRRGTAAVPGPAVIGLGGRIPPNEDVISTDETNPPINLQDPVDAAANPFDPEHDGIDFYESLEGMLVTIEEPMAVSATRRFGSFSSELFTVPNDGATASALTSRGALLLQPDPDNRGDQNPERVQIQFDASSTTTGTLFPGSAPVITVGDRLGNVTGVVGYSFGNFEVNATQTFEVIATELEHRRSRAASPSAMTMTTTTISTGTISTGTISTGTTMTTMKAATFTR